MEKLLIKMVMCQARNTTRGFKLFMERWTFSQIHFCGVTLYQVSNLVSRAVFISVTESIMILTCANWQDRTRRYTELKNAVLLDPP